MSGMKSRERNVRKNLRQWISFVHMSHTIQTTSSKKRRMKGRCFSVQSRNWSGGTFHRKLRVHVSLLKAAREALPFPHLRPSIIMARHHPSRREPCQPLPPSKRLFRLASSSFASRWTRGTKTNGRATVIIQTADLWDINLLFYYEIKLFEELNLSNFEEIKEKWNLTAEIM